METTVTAEFDSVDLADLASGRVRAVDGVTGVEVLGHDPGGGYGAGAVNALFPFFQVGTTASYSGIPPVYGAAGVPAYGMRNQDMRETELRREALLQATVISETAARSAGALMRSLGGRRVHIGIHGGR